MNTSHFSRRELLSGVGATLGLALLPPEILSASLQSEAPALTGNPKLADPRTAFPRTIALLGRLQQEKVQIGSQLYISRSGKPLADFAMGLSRTSVPMTTGTMMIWFSSTKTITAAAVAQQWERGKFELDDAVAKYIPEFGNRGKEAVTIRHILTHRGGFRMADGGNRSKGAVTAQARASAGRALFHA